MPPKREAVLCLLGLERIKWQQRTSVTQSTVTSFQVNHHGYLLINCDLSLDWEVVVLGGLWLRGQRELVCTCVS